MSWIFLCGQLKFVIYEREPIVESFRIHQLQRLDLGDYKIKKKEATKANAGNLIYNLHSITGNVYSCRKIYVHCLDICGLTLIRPLIQSSDF